MPPSKIVYITMFSILILGCQKADQSVEGLFSGPAVNGTQTKNVGALLEEQKRQQADMQKARQGSYNSNPKGDWTNSE